jgi:hypothetical protein
MGSESRHEPENNTWQEPGKCMGPASAIMRCISARCLARRRAMIERWSFPLPAASALRLARGAPRPVVKRVGCLLSNSFAGTAFARFTTPLSCSVTAAWIYEA